MIIPKLALRNLLGAGLRTWLNVVVLSFSFVAIIWLQGIYNGMNDQVEQATVDALYGGGQYWQANYDPYDPLTLDDAHGIIPEALQNWAESNAAAAILIRRGSIYPNGRFRNVLLKGIDPEQTVLTIPSAFLQSDGETIPALIGSRMAESTGLQKGDEVTVQWRDVNGTFDAQEVKIVEVMKTTVQEIDNGQLWLPLRRLQEMAGMPEEATVVVLGKGTAAGHSISGWRFRDLEFLLQDLRAMVQMKSISASIMYFILLFLDFSPQKGNGHTDGAGHDAAQSDRAFHVGRGNARGAGGAGRCDLRHSATRLHRQQWLGAAGIHR